MNEQQQYNDYLAGLKNAEREQGQAKLRTLALQFQSTLSRLPELQIEMNSFLQTHELLDYEGLLQRFEPVLQKASDCLFEIDKLSPELTDAPELKQYINTLQNTVTFANADKVIQDFLPLKNKTIKKQKKERAIFEALLEWVKKNANTNNPPQNIEELKQLTKLNIRENQLTVLPDSIANLTNLTELSVWENQLTSLPESIGNLTNLTKLIVLYNQLTSLPESIGNLTNLTGLGVGGNQLTSLPDSIGNLTNLTGLGVEGNKLTSLPESIGNLINLTGLNVEVNKLTSLPDFIGNLTNLTGLAVGGNQLTSLPDSIGNLTNLTELDICDNQLTSLPDWINNLDNLSEGSKNLLQGVKDKCKQRHEAKQNIIRKLLKKLF